MTIEKLIELLAKFGPDGIELAETLWKRWTSGGPIVQKDFDDLRAFVKPADVVMKEQLTAAGIALDSPQGKAMLALTQ